MAFKPHVFPVLPLYLLLHRNQCIYGHLRGLPPPEQHLGGLARALGHHEDDGARAGLAVAQLDLVVEQQVAQDHLDLLRGEEAARARVLAEPEVLVRVPDAGELVLARAEGGGRRGC